MAFNYHDILERDEAAPRMVAGPREGSRVPVVYAAGLTKESKGRSTHSGEAKMAKGKGKKKGKKKAKLSKAARREISMKNLRKAQKARGKALAQARKGGKKKLTKAQSKKAAKRSKALRHLGAGHAMAKKKKAGKAVRAPKMPKHAPVRAAAKRGGKKRKLTKAERATISRRNLKKARAALKRGGKKSGSRKRSKGKLTKAQRKTIWMRNLGKARAARKRSKKAGRKHKVGSYSYSVRSKKVHVPAHKSWEAKGKRKQSRKQRAASLRNLRKARAARKHGGGHRAAESSKRGKKRKGGKRKQSQKQRAASLANLSKARAARKSATKRHKVGAYAYHRQGGKRKVPGHLSFEYAMENPLVFKEAAWGVGSGLGWFLVTDGVDRFWATHALTAKGTTDAAGHALYADTPVTTATIWTGYVNAYNPTAIAAPMNLVRWVSGIAMVAIPFVGAKYVANPFWRSQLQVAGYGAVMRVGGKAFIDLIAKIAMWTKTGQRLYDGEMRAAVMTSADQSPLTSLPAAGLGRVGCGACPSCVMGVGACDHPQAGVGYPSMPRETGTPSAPTSTLPSSANQPANPPPPPLPPPDTSNQTNPNNPNSPLQGVSGPARLPPRSTSLYDWGHKEEDAEVAA